MVTAAAMPECYYRGRPQCVNKGTRLCSDKTLFLKVVYRLDFEQ